MNNTIRSGLGIWKRPQQDRVDDREHRRRRADPERQRRNRGDRECRLLSQHAERVFQILNESFHMAPLVILSEAKAPALRSASDEGIALQPRQFARLSNQAI